jgi:AraC-like DNA-binding protein
MGMVRVGVLAGFEQQVRELHGDPGAVLRMVGLDDDYLVSRHEEDFMSYDLAESILHEAAVATACPHFAALLGTRHDMGVMGPVGYLMQQSSDVGTALQELSDHHSIQVKDASTVDIGVIGEQAFASYQNHNSAEFSRYSAELAIAHALIIIRALCGDRWKPTRVNFRHKQPDQLMPYLKIFSAPVYFGQFKNEIVFPKIWLDKPILQADSGLKQILHAHIMQLEEVSAATLSEDVVGLIREMLPTGDCSIGAVADRMAMHERTLQRMLKRQGTSFSQLVDQVRMDIATDRLANSAVSIIQLSDYLGYADNTAFTRAFKRWHGITPMQWRKSPDSRP